MTLNGVIASFYVISPNSIALQAYYVTVVEDNPILAKTDPPCIQRSLSAIAELLVLIGTQ